MSFGAVQFIEFGVDSPLYAKSFELRNQVLRKPLGLDLRDDDLSRETESAHFALQAEGEIVAYVMTVPASGRSVLLRQMCVVPQYQQQGYGRQLLQAVEHQLRQRGVMAISMAARVTACDFYQALGYQTCGEEFLSVTIPHVRMKKTL